MESVDQPSQSGPVSALRKRLAAIAAPAPSRELRPITLPNLTQIRQRLTASVALPRADAILYAAYLAILCAAELIVVWWPLAGILLHTTLLTALLAHAVASEGRERRPLLIALTLGPLIRIMSLSLPLAAIAQIWWYFIISVPLFLAAFVIIRLLGISRLDLGLTPGALPTQALIVSIGIPLGLMEYLILRPPPFHTSLDWRVLWWPALILLVSTGFMEELIFRGILQYLALRTSAAWGIPFVSAVFALLHIGHRSAVDVVFVFVVALFFAAMARETRSLLGVTIAHGLTNIGLFLIFPIIFAR